MTPKYSLLLVALLALVMSACVDTAKSVEQAKQMLENQQPRQAVELLNRAIKNGGESADLFNMRGVAYFSLQEFDNALLDYDRAIALDKRNYKPFYNRALVKEALQNYQGAIEDYSQAIALAIDEADLYLNRAAVFATTGDTAAALRDLNKTLELRPEDAMAHYNRGNILYRNAEWPAASEDFRAAIRADAKFARAHFALALSLLQQSPEQSEQPCLHLQQAKRLGHPEAEALLEKYCRNTSDQTPNKQ